MEMAVIVINKADGDNIRKAKLESEFNRALHLFLLKSAGHPTATCSIIQEGIPQVWETIEKFLNLPKQ
jgi:putative protein kinase ArgK-like GTPase of G3E family